MPINDPNAFFCVTCGHVDIYHAIAFKGGRIHCSITGCDCKKYQRPMTLKEGDVMTLPGEWTLAIAGREIEPSEIDPKALAAWLRKKADELDPQ